MDFMTQTTFYLWEVSAVCGVLAMWIVYLIVDKRRVEAKNEKLVNALHSLATSISESVSSISNLNGRLVRKIQDHLTRVEKLIIDRLPKK